MEKKILHVTIQTQDKSAFTKFMKEHSYLDTAGEHHDKDGNITAEAFVPESRIIELQKQPGVKITVKEDAAQVGMKRQLDVSSVNQFARTEDGQSPPSPPRGFAKKQ